MKSCPTSNMNRAQLWGFEVSHILLSFIVLTISNVTFNMLGIPTFFSWGVGLATLGALRIVSHGQKNGHLEMLGRFVLEPHIYLGHQGRKKIAE